MYTTVINEIVAFLLGRKYYVNIVTVRGQKKQEACCHIFSNMEAAHRHMWEINATSSYTYVETVSFRSRKIIPDATVQSYGGGVRP